MDRREFLRNSARTLIVAGLGVMSGMFVYRNYTTEETCELKNMCKDCNSLDACGKPAGLKYKKELK